METLGYTLLALLCKDCSLPWKEKPFVAQKQDKLALRMHGTFYGDYLDPSFEFLKGGKTKQVPRQDTNYFISQNY